LKENQNQYDAIIVDSSDPIGPALHLYENSFYQLMFNSLKEGGMVCTLSEGYWLQLDLITKIFEFSKKIYKSVDYATTSIPMYPSGLTGFMLCCKGENKINVPKRTVAESLENDQVDSLRYYNEIVHRCAFVMPTFASKALGKPNTLN
jgi:spermidine synthase